MAGSRRSLAGLARGMLAARQAAPVARPAAALLRHSGAHMSNPFGAIAPPAAAWAAPESRRMAAPQLHPATIQALSSVAAMEILGDVVAGAIPFPADLVIPTEQPKPALPEQVDERSRADRVAASIREHIAAGASSAFTVCDLADVRAQHARWREALPRVQPFYAVKCNPDPNVVATLAAGGAGFDCASKAEIDLIRGLGVDPARIVYANPCKQPAHLAHAERVGVDLTVFDSEDELAKVAAKHPRARLLMRILVDDSQAVCTMSQKYGAPLRRVPALLRTAQDLGLAVQGVSFHVGSGCRGAEPFVDAVRAARHAFDIAASLGAPMALLDIGGGFPGGMPDPGRGSDDRGATFESIADRLREALDLHFPAESGVRLIAEPGRFFVSSAGTLVTRVIGRKEDAQARPMYFVDDGLYGSFNSIMYDHATVAPVALDSAGAPLPLEEAAPASVWGPTCDGLDCVVKEAPLPPLRTGDWVRWDNMGAYTSAAGSTFNGMDRPPALYI